LTVILDIPKRRIGLLQDSFQLFTEALTAAQANPTHASILRRQEAQAATTAILREFVNQFLRFPPAQYCARRALTQQCRTA
jgi:hypothetical protein